MVYVSSVILKRKDLAFHVLILIRAAEIIDPEPLLPGGWR